MRARFLFAAVLVLGASSLFAKDVYLSVGGSANGFFTDARIFNPSFDKDIVITARYLPAGNVDNSAVTPKEITVPKRSQVIYDDVVNSLFGGGAALGAIRLTSDDDFVATQRIYADLTGSGRGTLGQFVPGLEPSAALTKGVAMQLKAGASAKGTFRTNWGGANPNPVVANISFKLYDRTNQLAGTNDLTVQPYGVISPNNIVGFFGNPDRDLSDSWFSFESDQPVFIYASIVDNTSTDPTFVTAAADSGVEPEEPPPPPVPTVNVTARNWEFTVTGVGSVRAGDEVRFVITSDQDRHGFHLSAPDGAQLINIASIAQNSVVERLVTMPAAGTYTFFCTYSLCGEGHTTMNGTFSVSQ